MGFRTFIGKLFGGGDEPPDAPSEERMVEAAGRTIDPDDEDGWRRLSGDAHRDLSPMSQDRMREAAYYLWDANLVANRLIELMVAYLLAEGVKLRAKDKSMQSYLDRFWADPINALDIKLEIKVRELSLAGEQCYPTFVNEVDGHVRLGYLDPKLIATVVVDPDNPEQPIGIITTKDKRGKARRYRVIVNGPEDVFTLRTREIRETFGDGEAFYFKVNSLAYSSRGRSDLRAGTDWLDGYDQFLFGEIERYNFLRAFVWDVTIQGADEAKVKAKAKEIKAPRAGSVRVHNEGETWKAESPDIKAGDTAEGARLFRNHVLGGATIPEHWFGGGGDVNRSTGESMGEPTFKVFTMRQAYIKYMLETMGTYAIRQALIAREGEPDWSDLRLGTEASMPEMTARDTTRYAAALTQIVTAVALAIEQGLMTEEKAVELIASVAAQIGIEMDPKEELRKARAQAAKRAEDKANADAFGDVTEPEETDVDPDADPADQDQVPA